MRLYACFANTCGITAKRSLISHRHSNKRIRTSIPRSCLCFAKVDVYRKFRSFPDQLQEHDTLVLDRIRRENASSLSNILSLFLKYSFIVYSSPSLHLICYIIDYYLDQIVDLYFNRR